MRVFVVEPDGAGGMVHYAYQLCTALAGQGADVTLVTGRHYELASLPHNFTVDPRMHLWPAVGEEPPPSRVAALVAGLHHKARRTVRGLRYAAEWYRLTRHLLTERPDVVQFAIIRFPFQGIFLRRLRRAGITLTQICHEFEPRERGVLARSVNRWQSHTLYRSFDRIYLHGEESRRSFLRTFDINPALTTAIRHGNEAMFLDLMAADGDRRKRYGLPPDVRVCLFFGGLRPSKGIEDLINAWSLVIDETDAHLIVCGQPAGIEPTSLEELVSRLGLSARVTIDAGYLPLNEVSGLFEIADVVVLPYRSAMASGVLQLAYAFGKPVVATSRGAFTEDVEDGRTGFLVEPCDVAGLGRALVKVLDNPAEASRMGRAARSESEQFAWEPIAASIMADYRKMSA